ncbi:MAG: hypothetical protein OCC49_17335 [Fibrobacterales bacterium]
MFKIIALLTITLCSISIANTGNDEIEVEDFGGTRLYVLLGGGLLFEGKQNDHGVYFYDDYGTISSNSELSTLGAALSGALTERLGFVAEYKYSTIDAVSANANTNLKINVFTKNRVGGGLRGYLFNKDTGLSLLQLYGQFKVGYALLDLSQEYNDLIEEAPDYEAEKYIYPFDSSASGFYLNLGIGLDIVIKDQWIMGVDVSYGFDRYTSSETNQLLDGQVIELVALVGLKF